MTRITSFLLMYACQLLSKITPSTFYDDGGELVSFTKMGNGWIRHHHKHILEDWVEKK